MTIDIHALLEKHPVTKKMLQPITSINFWDHVMGL